MEIRSLTHAHTQNNNNCWANYVFQHDFKNQNARQVFVAAAAVATIIRQKPTDTARCWTNENMCSVCVRMRVCVTVFMVYGLARLVLWCV